MLTDQVHMPLKTHNQQALNTDLMIVKKKNTINQLIEYQVAAFQW